MKELILAAKAFAEPSRVRIATALRERELCVCELCDALAVTQSTLSTHLQVMRQAGVVSARKRGKWMYYAIAPEARGLVETLVEFFSGSLKGDATLRRDARRLKERLSLREDGLCRVGFRAGRYCCQEGAR